MPTNRIQIVMKDKPSVIVFNEQIFTVGQNTFLESVMENENAVVFEDNEETGYFYAVNFNKNFDILDALHIYNVNEVVDKQIQSSIKILWTIDLSKAILSINNYYYAIFDFKNKAGYCRNGFPNSRSEWTLIKERELTDEFIITLFQNH